MTAARIVCIIFIVFACKGATPVRVPFVGCKSGSQVGPEPAPHGASKTVQIDAATAKKLAYYTADGAVGVLATRGWYCSGLYGSSGSTLLVSPEPIEDKLLSSAWHVIAGPGIEVAEHFGDTSGRFEVSRVIARVFPAHRASVERVIKGDFAPTGGFPFGPYRGDRLTYRGDRIVEYQTAPHSEGLGTISLLEMNDRPIDGVAILQGPTPDLLLLTVRLPPEMNALAPLIIQQLERDNAERRPTR